MAILYKMRKVTAVIISAFGRLAMLACMISVFAVGIDVVLRKLTDARFSVPGSSEITAYSLVLMCMLSIPVLQLKKGHISLDLMRTRLPGVKKWEAAVLGLESAVCLLFTYASALKVRMFLQTGTASDVLNIPKWPFAASCFLGFAEMAVLLMLDCCILAVDLKKERNRHEAKP